jgi:hypothetical protein
LAPEARGYAPGRPLLFEPSLLDSSLINRSVMPTSGGGSSDVLREGISNLRAMKTPTAVIVTLAALYLADALYCQGKYLQGTTRMTQSIAMTLGYH